MSKRRRTESPNAVFEQGYARGWAFGVPEAFRASLDISLDMRADKAANDALAESLGRKPTAAERVMRPIWTQGTPPAYDFSRGSMLHEPAHAHTLPWADALPILTRSVVVLDAKPDGEVSSLSPTGSNTVTAAGDIDSGPDAALPPESEHTSANANGWVEFELYQYEKGTITQREQRRLTQNSFVHLLKNGVFI